MSINGDWATPMPAPRMDPVGSAQVVRMLAAWGCELADARRWINEATRLGAPDDAQVRIDREAVMIEWVPASESESSTPTARA